MVIQNDNSARGVGEYDFSLLKLWADNLLSSNNKGVGTNLPLLSDKECMNDSRVSIREVHILSCRKPYHLCGQGYGPSCSPYRAQILVPLDKSEWGLKMLEYKSRLEQISAGKCSIELIKEVFTLCYDLHHLADIEGQRKSLARASLRYQQNGRCIFPGCKKERQLHLHRCLPGYLGGEYSEDNCVLVCAQHHPRLELFRSKSDVEDYLSKMVNAEGVTAPLPGSEGVKP